ncbi:nucleotide disphospho-sugar-binding domain-containing protein [Amycolatopsis sp.]|uniref:nucleotide disphospho-sugar-binding domain-containing protein n=1 Tax=Amycolatopsis sp. TaxID=37632 RepID=UPI002D7F4831|nr:nucleotide disphospho-sugar-binding domain-containing protein [Amycolatopsis sp.]HET6708437.1 nucleotide disphospho-sugar-binding domain-containing protein [Amycolatopsis sp.]
MRVLMAAPSSPARLHNLAPLAWALRMAGHDVKIAGRPAFVEEILRTSCVAVELESGDEASLAESAALVEFAELWRPQVVVADARAPAGTAAARAVGALAVRVLGALDEADPENAGYADITLDTVPPSLRAESGSARAVRHVPYFGPVVVPNWLRRKARRSRALLSLADDAMFGPVFDAVAEADFELVCAAEPARIPAGLAMPANVRLVDSAPPAALLPTCAAVIHDGDAALALAAAAHGLPQISLTESAIAPRIAAAGAGKTGAGEGIRTVASDVELSRAASALREEIAALPAPRAVVAELIR